MIEMVKNWLQIRRLSLWQIVDTKLITFLQMFRNVVSFIWSGLKIPRKRQHFRSLSLPVSCEFDEEIELILTRKQKFYKTKGYKYLSNSSPFDFLDSENLFYTLHLRLTQFQLENGVYECIASNLDKEEFPPEKIKELYHMRWGIETSFRELKYTIGLTNLHSKNVEYICQKFTQNWSCIIFVKLFQQISYWKKETVSTHTN